MTDTMGKMDIAFPNLGLYLENVPQYIYIGNFSIAIYGIIIAVGMILGILMAVHIAKKTGQDSDMYWDLSIWLIIFGVIGARIYYVIFFFDAYKDNLLQIFNFRAGGLAIYGGVIAGVITVFVYCVLKKKYMPEILDTVVYGLLVGQIIGRWGNFFNREVFGEYTDSIFAMRLPIDAVRSRDITSALSRTIEEGTNYIQVHPTFLYESLWNLTLLIILLIYLKHRVFKGQIFLMYIAGYGIGRAWIEYIRTDQLYIPGTSIPVNMVLGIVLAIAAIFAIGAGCYSRKGQPVVGYGLKAKAAEPADTQNEDEKETEEGKETSQNFAEDAEEEGNTASGSDADVGESSTFSENENILTPENETKEQEKGNFSE